MDNAQIAQIVEAGRHSTSDNDVYLALTAVMSLFLVVVLVAVVVRWLSQRRAASGMAADPALWDTARRMESRIESLEAILDSELPGWRSRSHT